ncbi:hypothetical protein [Leptolyngbya ohadii]|uniref:hypothetical protein n=1 Tax=Leptolyngbya ohadii TaxID=1962290 RepID=UPI0015C5AA45|nr:hypothetical protein [Leptolyngbya ohadii]
MSNTSNLSNSAAVGMHPHMDLDGNFAIVLTLEGQKIAALNCLTDGNSLETSPKAIA